MTLGRWVYQGVSPEIADDCDLDPSSWVIGNVKMGKRVVLKPRAVLRGDGEDISMLTLNWQRFLPNTVFLCPNAEEMCPINPSGFQWFDLTKEDPQYILEQSIKAEKKIYQFISEVKKEFKLENSHICLCGFSQ